MRRTGHAGRTRRGLPQTRSAFTIIEILVVVAIIALLLSILVPALNRARMQAKMAVCLGNNKGLGLGFAQFSHENKYTYPDHYKWFSDPRYWDGIQSKAWQTFPGACGGNGWKAGELWRYVRNNDAYNCPQDISDGHRYANWVPSNPPISAQPVGKGSYCMQRELGELSGGQGRNFKDSILLQTPSRVMIVMEQSDLGNLNDASVRYEFSVDAAAAAGLNDAEWEANLSQSGERLSDRHGGKGDVLYFDGHGESLLAWAQFNSGRRLISVKTGMKYDKVYADQAAGIYRYRQGVRRSASDPKHSLIY